MNYTKKNVPSVIQRDHSVSSHILNSSIIKLRQSSSAKTRNQNLKKLNNISYLNIKNPVIVKKESETKNLLKVEVII